MTLRPDMQPPDKTPSAGTPTRPKPQLQEPTVPLVVFTAFDAATAEELSRRLQNTAHPADNPPPPSHSQPPPTYQSDIADYEARQEERLGIHSAAHDRGQTIFDVQTLEPETTTQDLEVAWSSEQPWLSLNAAEMSDYFSAQEDKLVREVAISLQHEKFILHHLEDPLEYLKIFAEYGWDEESDEVAEEFIQWYVERFRPELEQQWDDILAGDAQSDLEYWIRNVANDERESVIVYDLETGETLFVRFGDRDSVTLQEWHQKLTEGRNIIVIHNHPNNSGASVADLSGAVWLDAEWLLVVNPDGTLHRHQKIDGEIVELKPLHFSNIVAPVDPVETVLHSIAYWIQTLREIGNPPEAVFEQGEADFRARLLKYATNLDLGSNLTTLSDTELLRTITSAVGLRDESEMSYGFPRYRTDDQRDFWRALFLRDTTENTGTPPGLLAMLQLWEDSARLEKGILETGPYELVYRSSPNKSLGISQVQIGVAIDMLNKHQDWFADLNLPRDRMKGVWGGYELTRGWSDYDVGYQLQKNDEFNIRVAGAYLAHLKLWLEEEHLPPLGVTVMDEHIESAHISTDDLWKLALVGYNQGTGHALARLQDRYDSGGAEAVENEVKGMLGKMGDIFGTKHTMPSLSELADLEVDLMGFLEGLPDLVPDIDVAAPHISEADRLLLAIAAHNRGWDHTLAELEVVFMQGGPNNVVAGIKRTLEIPYVSNVFLRSDEALTKYGLSYDDDKKQG